MKRQKLNTLRILWAAHLGATLMFLVVGYLVVSQRGAVPPPEPLVSVGFTFAASSLALGSVWIPKWLQRQALKRLALPTIDAPFAGPSSERRRARRFTDANAARIQLLSAIQPVFVVDMAMAEAVATLGFVLWFLGLDVVFVLPFFIVCWALMASKFPVLSRFEGALEDAYDARLA